MVFDKLRLNTAYNDYRHLESEDAEFGTLFKNQGIDSRIEAVQLPWWIFDHGVFGFQVKSYEFQAYGEDAIVPRSDIRSYAFFVFENIVAGDLTYEFGGRVEHQTVNSDDAAGRSHTPISGSASMIWNATESESLSFSYSHFQRAPQVQELFSFGPHLAIRSFEIGNKQLKEERSNTVELGIHLDRDWLKADMSLYHSWIGDYIAQTTSGLHFDPDNPDIDFHQCSKSTCLPVLQIEQRNATFNGFEAEAIIPLSRSAYGISISRSLETM